MTSTFADKWKAQRTLQQTASLARAHDLPLSWRAAIAVIVLLSGGLWTLIWFAVRSLLSLWR